MCAFHRPARSSRPAGMRSPSIATTASKTRTIQITGSNNSTGASWPIPVSPETHQHRHDHHRREFHADRYRHRWRSRRPRSPRARTGTAFGVAGGGTFTGNIANSGEITIEGNQSAGIAIDSTLAAISSLTGGNRSTSSATMSSATAPAITGNVSLTSGTIQVQGAGAEGVAAKRRHQRCAHSRKASRPTGYRSFAAGRHLEARRRRLQIGGSAVLSAMSPAASCSTRVRRTTAPPTRRG